MLRTAIRDVASLIASEALRPPSPEVEARHRAEWPALWWRIDRLRGLLDELDTVVHNLRRFRR
jgi:hypothetical protein